MKDSVPAPKRDFGFSKKYEKKPSPKWPLFLLVVVLVVIGAIAVL